MMFKNILLVGFGGGIGSVARYLCQKYIYAWHPHAFPVSTFFVNISGCLLIGLFYGLAEKGQLLSAEWRLLLMTGLCGGFTTFSTFANENVSLLKNGEFLFFTLYVAGSVILGISCTFLGIYLTK
jgi:CrcB protein